MHFYDDWARILGQLTDHLAFAACRVRLLARGHIGVLRSLYSRPAALLDADGGADL